jgi:YHS domain-containing protein
MKLTSVILGTAIMVAGIPLAAHAQAAVEKQAVKPVPVGNKICPVSGEKITIESSMAPVTYEYKGKVYNLCCSGCVKAFAKDPEKYSKIADDEVANSQKQVTDKPMGDMPTGHQM